MTAVRNLDRTCTAKRSDGSGRPCRAYAIAGGTVCRIHGGSAPHVKANALRNVAEARQMVLEKHAGPAIQELRRILDSADTVDADKLRAIGQILAASGITGQTNVKLELETPTEPPSEQLTRLLDDMHQRQMAQTDECSMCHGQGRVMKGLVSAEVVLYERPEPAPQLDIVDAELVEEYSLEDLL